MTKSTRKTQLSPLSSRAQGDLRRLRRDTGIFRRLFRRQHYRSARLKVYLANARDFRQSRKLAAVLAPLQSAALVDFPVANNMIGGEWKPFRVERGVTGSIRGEIAGHKFTGTSTPNLLDSSSVIFLQNADGETMRTLIPSHATASEMLARSLERWRATAGYKQDYYEDYWNRNQDTHTSSVIHNFARSGQWTNTLTHPEMIDMIDASCQRSDEQRPVIRLTGALIQKGVALATAIEVNGERRVVVPTGFFKALTGAVRQFVPAADEPRLIAA